MFLYVLLLHSPQCPFLKVYVVDGKFDVYKVLVLVDMNIYGLKTLLKAKSFLD